MQTNIREGAAPSNRNIDGTEAGGKDVEKNQPTIASHQKEPTTSLYDAASEGVDLAKKSQRQLSSSSSSTNGSRLAISENRASSVSNLKIEPQSGNSKEATTTISKHTQNTKQDVVEKQSKASESESGSKATSSKSSQSVISDAKETKQPDSVWSSLLSNFGISPNKTPSPLPACPEIPPGLQGRISLDLGILPLSQVAAKLPRVGEGGESKPANCSSNHRVAVIVPYRDRVEHLARLTYHLHPILQRQQVDYAIFVVEQAGKLLKNVI